MPLNKFRKSQEHYVNVALSHGATPIFLSSIVLCPSPEADSGEAGEISKLLPEYGACMKQYARELQSLHGRNIPFIDMNGLTREWLREKYPQIEDVEEQSAEGEILKEANDKACESADNLYMPDHVHLVERGAWEYACLVAEEIKRQIS